MFKKTFHAIVITFWTSCFIIPFIISQIKLSNFSSLNLIIDFFLGITYIIIFGLIVYVLPGSLLTQLLLRKVPDSQYGNVYKILSYFFIASVFGLTYIFLFFVFGFLSYLVIIIFYCSEEFLNKYEKGYKFVTRLSYIVSSSILCLLLYRLFSNNIGS
jgi:hypothetical protein